MLFDRTQSPLSGKRIVGAQARRLGLALGLALLASLPMGRAHVASAANVYPTPSTIVTPWSWQQFKQSLGLLGTADTAYVAANPSSSTVAPGTALSNGYLQSVLGIAVPTGLTSNPDGTEVRGFVLGDYGTLEPNSVDTAGDQNSTYNFFETANSNNITQANITGWFSPLYAISNARDLVIQTVDDGGLETGPTVDDPTQAATVTNNGFTTITTTAALGQVGNTYEQAAPTSNATFSWTLTAPTPGYYTIYANIPEGTGAAVTNVPYTIVSNGVTTSPIVSQAAHGYQLVGGVTTTVNAQTIVVTVTATSTTATATQLIYADSVQLRQPRQVTIDNTDPPTTAGNPFEVLDGTDNFAKDTNAQDFTGTDYLESPLLTRVDVDNTAGLPSGPSTAGASFVDWIFPIQTTGSYALSAYYPEPPSADNADDTFTPEYYSTDAEYTVKVYPVATAAALTTAELQNQTLNAASTDGTPGPTYVQTALINQSINGGQFRQIFSQLSIPAGSTAVLQLDNTSDNTGDVSGTSTPRIVVADAAQLNPDDGSVYGTPVAANVSDYPELRYGYNTANAATIPTGSTETGLIGGFTATSGGGQPVFYTAPFLNPTTGSEDANTPQYHGLPNTTTATDLGLTAASTLTPDSEVTYFGRTENLPYTGDDGQFFGTPGPAQQSGAMYAVDGLNGNIIWKYGTTNTIIDDSNTVDFTTTGFGASQAAPATDFYGAGYRTAPATTAAGTANTLATWTLPLAEGSGTAEYAVYAWFPSATASTATPAEAHISDAQYTISDSETVGNTTTIVPVTVAVSQVTGGKWVPINNPNRTDNAFVLGFGSSSVTLSNANPNLSADYTNQVGTTATTPNPVVAADAVMFVPLNNTGTVMSTPLLVRQMNVLTQAGTYQPRDVVIFTDNLGKMYCVDAAGNQDADNTLIDEDTGDAVSLDSAGYPAVGLNGTTGTNTTSTGITLPTPYNLTVRNFGTTTVYWIWQPSAATNAAILHTTSAGTGDSIETAPDASRDMPAPSSFLMNSPTAALAKDPNNPWYDATLFVGNPNGTLYSLNANGVAANATPTTAGVAVQPTEANVTDYKQYRLSQNATVNTVDVNWWFNTGEAISYAPAFDPSKVQNGDQHVYVTTYSSSFNNQGHLYSIDAVRGGYGNQGSGSIGAAASNAPGSYNYNVNPVSYWSFPDKYNSDIPAGLADHVYNNKIPGRPSRSAICPARPTSRRSPPTTPRGFLSAPTIPARPVRPVTPALAASTPSMRTVPSTGPILPPTKAVQSLTALAPTQLVKPTRRPTLPSTTRAATPTTPMTPQAPPMAP